MGQGDFDSHQYTRARASRQARHEDDFAFSESTSSVHETLNPRRIKDKVFGLLESRDNAEHPESTPIILTFDVTGSNKSNAAVVQKDLPTLIGKLTDVMTNPQIAIWANDDVQASCGANAIQVSEFESDNRIDDAIRHIWLTGDGGGNGGESYDLLLFAASRLVVTDALEKRNKKGHLLLYADEHFRESVRVSEVKLIFGVNIEADIPIASMIQECREKWNISILWPYSGYVTARKQYEALFGHDNVYTVEGPSMLGNTVASIVSATEQKTRRDSSVNVEDLEFSNRSV